MAAVLVGLSDYLAKSAMKRFGFGSLDCCTFMADWLIANGCQDPMLDRRGTYTKENWKQFVDSEGGLLESCLARFSKIGLKKVDEAKQGDVSVVMAPSIFGMVQTGSICINEKHRAVMSKHGLMVAQYETLAVWSMNA